MIPSLEISGSICLSLLLSLILLINHFDRGEARTMIGLFSFLTHIAFVIKGISGYAYNGLFLLPFFL